MDTYYDIRVCTTSHAIVLALPFSNINNIRNLQFIVYLRLNAFPWWVGARISTVHYESWTVVGDNSVGSSHVHSEVNSFGQTSSTRPTGFKYTLFGQSCSTSPTQGWTQDFHGGGDGPTYQCCRGKMAWGGKMMQGKKYGRWGWLLCRYSPYL